MTVSVVIPTLNEAAQIEATLHSVLTQPGPVEVIVVDGGSDDSTVPRAQAHARVLEATRGRAQQMNAGAADATGDVLLFLHADTHLPEGALDAVRSAFAEPGVSAGCFRTTFDAEGFWMRLWSLRLWMRWHRLAFGDRAPFVRREAFEAIGGFPEQPIFEDLELVRRLRRQGRFVFLDEAVVTSARRYQRHGAMGQQLHNLALWSAWNLRLPPTWFKRFYPDAPGERD